MGTVEYLPLTYPKISLTIAGDTTGTWPTDNSIGIEIDFGLGVGSTYSNQCLDYVAYLLTTWSDYQH